MTLRFALRGPLGVFAALLFAPGAFAGTLSGVVRNATTGKPVSHQDVVLVALQGGMQEVATVQTDNEGRYSFNRPEIGQGPLLVRVPYHNVTYNQAAPPGRGTADIDVYDSTSSPGAVQLATRTIIFQPSGSKLTVGEEFQLQNKASPPVSYFDPKGTFIFELPTGAQLGQVSAAGPAGMPVTQGTTDKGKNRYAIDFPIKPGESSIRVSYELPYVGNQAAVRQVAVIPAQHILLAAPAGMQVAGDGFSPAGTEQGYSVFTRDNVAAGTSFGITVSGSAPPPAAAQGGDAGPGGAAGAPATAGETIQPLSPRLGSFQWIVVGGMGFLFLLGFFFLMRRAPAAAAGNGAAVAAAPMTPAAARQKPQRSAVSPPPSAAPPVSAQSAFEQADRAARSSLDEMKDTLFRLELRRQAGTISEEDYGRERARIEALLREFVRG
jgi:hypothetical protein